MMPGMHGGRIRSWAAYIILAFFAGTLLSPHQHHNSIADLVSDGQSDSGVLVLDHAPTASGDEPTWSVAATVDDEPCLACFWHDTTAAVGSVLPLSVDAVLLAIAVFERSASPSLALIVPPPSRGPPV